MEMDRAALIQQFCSVTGASEDVATNMLDACADNLDLAVGMMLDSDSGNGGNPPPPDVTASHSSTSAAPVPPDVIDNGSVSDDDVRAPIPQKSEVLVDDQLSAYTHAWRARRRKVRSVFDGFRDFQMEARQQELEQGIETGAAGSSKDFRKRKTLEDLFRPPIDILHKGTFVSAREVGKQMNRYLMVNVQNVQEFSCQVLNRDVWSTPNVKDIVRHHFVLWQVYNDSGEGAKYIQFYPVKAWPYVAILDPRTGELLEEWNKLDSTIFCELANNFLATHRPLCGMNSPPERRLRESLVDASEDSQLEAAIRASMEDGGGVRAQPSSHVLIPDNISDLSDSEGPELETFSDSGEDTPAEHVNMAAALKRVLSDSDGERSRSPKKSRCERKMKSSSRGVAPPPVLSGEEGGSSEPGLPAAAEPAVSWRDFLGSESDEKTSIAIRYPNGNKDHFQVPQTTKLQGLIQYVIEAGYPNERFELVTNFPKRRLSILDWGHSLKDVGLVSRETVFVQER